MHPNIKSFLDINRSNILSIYEFKINTCDAVIFILIGQSKIVHTELLSETDYTDVYILKFDSAIESTLQECVS